jgi:hypothetical protein
LRDEWSRGEIDRLIGARNLVAGRRASRVLDAKKFSFDGKPAKKPIEKKPFKRAAFKRGPAKRTLKEISVGFPPFAMNPRAPDSAWIDKAAARFLAEFEWYAEAQAAKRAMGARPY